MPSTRCSAFVFDITTKRDRKCKLHRHFQNVCYIHAQRLYKESVTTIQRVWRGYQKRTKLDNLFYGLPRELQLNIVKYVRRDFYMEKKWIPSVRDVYITRIINYHSEVNRLKLLFGGMTLSAWDFHNQLNTLIDRYNSDIDKLDILLNTWQPRCAPIDTLY